MPVHLDSAHANTSASRKKFQLFLAPQSACDQRPGHNRAEPLHGEDAINGKPGNGMSISRLDTLRGHDQGMFQFFDPRPRQRTGRHNGRVGAFQKSPAKKFLHLQPHHVEHFRVDRV